MKKTNETFPPRTILKVGGPFYAVYIKTYYYFHKLNERQHLI